MFITNEQKHEFRRGDHGPKYLIKDDNFDMGVVVLKSGQEFDKHYHATATETFLTLSGEVHMYVNDELHILKVGDVLRCDPCDIHFVKNKGVEDWKAVFIKAPHVENDSIYN